MRLEKHRQDQMTPAERITSAGEGKMVDRVITIPFMGELKCYLSGISIRDFWFDAEKIAQAERIAFNRWGYDRIVLGPNTRGIVEALGGTFIYPKDGIPYIESPYITDYGILDRMEKELGETPTVIATGGLARFITPLCRHETIFDDALLLKGLLILYRKNTQ